VQPSCSRSGHVVKGGFIRNVNSSIGNFAVAAKDRFDGPHCDMAEDRSMAEVGRSRLPWADEFAQLLHYADVGNKGGDRTFAANANQSCRGVGS